MPKILLSFLGTGNYQPVRYRLGQRIARATRLSAAAIGELLPDHRPVLLATREAYAKNWEVVEASFAALGLASPQRVEIPSGKSEAEIWKTVEILVSAVPEGASVILDVTHGFRAQPLLVYATMGLLAEMGHARTERILYCAYEARDDEGIAPIFDLSPLLELGAWSRALADLRRYGYATPLRQLLREIAARAHKEARDHKPLGLVGLGDTLEAITRALSVLRPVQAFEAAATLRERIARAEADLKAMPELRPLASFLRSGLSNYLRLGGSEALFSRQGLPSLGHMIRLYLELEQYPQAITLAREALVTLRTLDNQTNPLDPDARKAAENEINAAATVLRLKGRPGTEDIIRYAELWNTLADLRNDVDHAGFRKKPRDAKSVQKQAVAICNQVANWLEEVSRG